MKSYYVNRIDIMPAYHLQRCAVCVPLHTVSIEEYMPWQKLPTVGLIQVEESELHEKGQTIYEIKVKAKLKEIHVLPAGPCVLRLVTTGSVPMLMGTAEKPSPLITTMKTYTAAPHDGAGCFLSASLKSEFPLLTII